MNRINVLDENTINLIAAGEVVDRPASVVKELVENAIDAGANMITVEIKNGGIEYIRITDNGSGFYKDDIKTAFLRHATSKIRTADDLINVSSMGFRGEALSSVAAVAKVELITKRPEDILGYRYTIEGGRESEIEEAGAPDGSTLIVRNLFFNTPARRKFLRSETAEANMITDVMQHLAMGRCDIAFKYIVSGKLKFQTGGNKDLKETIYRLYGRDIADELIPIEYTDETGLLRGYLGKPTLVRANRNFETYYINSRYIHSDIVDKGIEEAYSEYLMQHKFPFCVLHIDMDFTSLDVNVHPAKKEVRFNDNNVIYDFVRRAVSKVLNEREMIPRLSFKDNDEDTEDNKYNEDNSDNKDSEAATAFIITDKHTSESKGCDAAADNNENIDKSAPSHGSLFNITFGDDDDDICITDEINKNDNMPGEKEICENDEISENNVSRKTTPLQLSFIEDEERFLTSKARQRYKIIGEVFDTYWIIEYADSVYFVDQHAAHEKVNYERMCKRMKEDKKLVQYMNPPVVVTLSGAEMTAYKEHNDYLLRMGFETEEIGGMDIALRGIPYELYFNKPKDAFLSLIDEIMSSNFKGSPEYILERIASMACKASVKGGNKISLSEAQTLLDELLTLNNPYNCPHGRPTIFTLSRTELEKKFKRITD